MSNKKYKYECPYPISKNYCDRSYTYGRCCCECEKKSICDYVCKNHPAKCGASSRFWR